MIETVDRPVTDETIDIVGFDEFPESLFMVRLGETDKYGALGVTTTGPEKLNAQLLATFRKEDHAKSFIDKYGVGDTAVEKTFDEAREIAVSKHYVHGLALVEDLPMMVGGVPVLGDDGKPKTFRCRTTMIHWVR